MNNPVKRVALIAFNGSTDLSVAGARDLFFAANLSLQKNQSLKKNQEASQKVKADIADAIKVITHDGKDVMSFSQAVIHADAGINDDVIKHEVQFDLILISGFWGNIKTIIKENKALIDWLAVEGNKGTVIASLHAGAFILAETGLLNGKIATVYWRLVDDFKAQYKQVILMPEKSITSAGNLYCSSGVSSAIEMSNYLIEKLWGIDIAQKVSRNFLMDVPRSNAQFNLVLDQEKQHNDEKVLAAQSWIETHFSSDFLMEELADKVGLSLRNLTRRFKKSTGDTPSHYLQKIRVEIAKDLLQTTDMSVDQITFRIGYFDVSSFCKLFKKITAKTPSEYRAEVKDFF